MFKSKKRIESAWAKGLMFGKAVGARDERDRLVTNLEEIANLVLLQETDFVSGYRQAIADIQANSWLTEVGHD